MLRGVGERLTVTCLTCGESDAGDSTGGALATALTAVTACLLVGCGGPAGSSPSSLPSAAQGGGPASSGGTVVLLDADEHGAIVFSGQEYRGMRRDGTVAWRVPSDPRGPDPVRCAATCPDVVRSGSVSSTNSPFVADPQPLLVVDGAGQPIGPRGGTKRRVLAAVGPAEYVATGHGWLEVWRRGAMALRLPTPGYATTWEPSADGSAALVVSAAPAGHQARWVELGSDGSSTATAGPPVAVDGAAACVSPDGRVALLIGQRPVVLDRNGRLVEVTDLTFASACSWSADTVVVAQYSGGTSGVRSRLRVVARDGAELWRRDLACEAGVTADPTSRRVALVLGDELVELDGGTEVRTLPGVVAARYTRAGALVVADRDGTPRWLTTATG